MGGWSELTRIGMPSFRRRRVSRWKGFSFLDLVMWAWKGPEMYAVTKRSPLRKLLLMLSCLCSAESGVLPQAGCNLSAVLDRKQTEVAVALLEHEVVGLPNLFVGGLEGEPGIGKAGFVNLAYAVSWLPFLEAFAWARWVAMASPQEEVVEGMADNCIL